MSWKPARTLAECNAMLTGPGQMFELENQIVDGRVLKVYKNLWPNLRTFFLTCVNDHRGKELVVFENDRVTYQQTYDQAVKAAGMLRDKYGVKKGDRVAIISRNYPEFIAAFWGIQLLGGVAVMVNAWLPVKPLQHSIVLSNAKVVIVDSERASKLDLPYLKREAGTKGFLVFRSHEAGGKNLPEMADWAQALSEYNGDAKSVIENDPGLLPDDNATIFFTSGTTGLPKGVLSSQRGFLSNILNSMVGRIRSFLRNGEMPPTPDPKAPQKGLLLVVPMFHVTGFTALTMLAHLLAVKLVLMRKWDPIRGAELIKRENIGIAGGVPSIVSDLIESPAAGAPSIESFLFGGAPAHAGLAPLAAKTFPAAVVSQAYGMTETNAVCASIGGNDYTERPTSTGLPCPINEMIIVKDGKIMKAGDVGEIWVKGANVMREYWRDPEATRKAITPDGWLKSGDLGTLDAEGFLYIRDRAKDIIIRGGENIDSVSVENALYSDERVMEAAAIGVPDKRLGELVAAVVTLKKRFKVPATEPELIRLATKSLPKFAIPVMVIIQEEPLERNPAGKIVKGGIRKTAAKEWEQRSRRSQKATAKL